MISGGYNDCYWFEFWCTPSWSSEDLSTLVEQDRELIDARRGLVTPPPEDSIPDDHYEALETRIDRLSDALDEGGFAHASFDVTSPVYRQSLWKYIQLFGMYAADREITNSEAETLHQIASESDEIGIKHFYRNLVRQEPVVYRWGGFSGAQCLDDRDVSVFSYYDAGGFYMNFSRGEEELYVNQPGILGYGYDPLSTVLVQPYELSWESDATRIRLAESSQYWIDSEVTRDFQNLLDGSPEAFLFQQGSHKRSVALAHLQNVRENIDNIELFRQEVDYVMSLFIHPQAIHMTSMALLMIVTNAETIDMGTRHLYVNIITDRYRNYVASVNRFTSRLNQLRSGSEDAAEFDRTIALAIRQDVVAAHSVIDEYLAYASRMMCSDETLGECEEHMALRLRLPFEVVAEIVPGDVVQMYKTEESQSNRGAVDSLLAVWSAERFSSDTTELTPQDQSLLQQLMADRNNCQVACMNHAQTEQLFASAYEITMPGRDRPWAKLNSTLFGASLLLGMMADGYFAAPPEAEGIRGIARNLTNAPRWAAASMIIFAFAQPTYAGLTMFTCSPDDVLEADDRQAPFASTYDLDGNCTCF